MRILVIHPRPDTLSGYYGLRAAAELFANPELAAEAAKLRVDFTHQPDWDAIAGAYELVHVSLRQLDYQPDLPARVAALRAAGVSVLIDVDAPLTGKSRLATLRRRLCVAAGHVRAYTPRGVATVEASTVTEPMGEHLKVHLHPAYVPVVKARPRPELSDTILVGVYPTTNENELTYLRDTAAYLRGLGKTPARWVVVGGNGCAIDQQRVSVVPQAAFSQAVRAAGKAGLQLAVRMYNPRHESLTALLRQVPAGVEIPEYPFVTVRQNAPETPANLTYQALSSTKVSPLSGFNAKPTPRTELTQLQELQVLILPAGGDAEEDGIRQLLVGLGTQLGVTVINNGTHDEHAQKPRQLARFLVNPTTEANPDNNASAASVPALMGHSLRNLYERVVFA